MDNIQLILYIVFLIGYFVFKLLTGKKNVTGQDTRKFDQDDRNVPQAGPGEYEPYDPEPGRPKSFEEILEELAGGNKQKEVKKREIQERKEEHMQHQPVDEWEPSPYPRNYEAQENEVYQKSVKEASKYQTLDERIDLDNIDINLKEVEDLDSKGTENVSSEYLAMFATLEGAKKAVVMSEILNRKY